MEPVLIGAISGLATAIGGLSGSLLVIGRRARANHSRDGQLVGALKDISTAFATAAAQRQQQTSVMMDRVAKMEERFLDQNTKIITALAQISGRLEK